MEPKDLPRLMILNVNGEDSGGLVGRYLAAASTKLGFDVDTVWCNQADSAGLRESLGSIKVVIDNYCPRGHFQLGKRRKEVMKNADSAST